MLPELTEKEWKLLMFVSEIPDGERIPIAREVAPKTGYNSEGGVHKALSKMRVMGLVRQAQVMYRNTVITEMGRDLLFSAQRKAEGPLPVSRNAGR